MVRKAHSVVRTPWFVLPAPCSVKRGKAATDAKRGTHPRGDGKCAQAVEGVGVGRGVEWQKGRWKVAGWQVRDPTPLGVLGNLCKQRS